MKNYSLTKTLYMEGIRCLKLLWLRINRPELSASIDEVTQHLFDTGHRVEEIAHKLFSGGVKIGNGSPLAREKVLNKTALAMHSDVPFIFEGGFEDKNCYCRIDVLERNDNSISFNLGEIKMCTKVKDDHHIDCAFQLHCIEQSGSKIDRVYLVHVNNKYEFDGEIDPDKFLVVTDITEETRMALLKIPSTNEYFRTILDGECPDISIGSHCKVPGQCAFYKYCHNNIPKESVFTLPYASKVIPELLSEGILLLKDIPMGYPLSKRQSAIVKSAKTGEPIIDRPAIRNFLNSLHHPHFYMDFETVSAAIPLFCNTRPYERVVFQYSLHVQKAQGEPLQHHQFLPYDKNDPREALLVDLLDNLESTGSILCWNASFQKSVLTLLSERFPQFSDKTEAVIDRIVDLIVPFRNGDYADVNFEGSASLKKVLPVLVPALTYSGMSISKGDHASLAYELYIEGNKTENEWNSIRQDLLAYCKLDTLAMVEIHKFLHKTVSKM